MKMAFIFDTIMLRDENDDYYAINLNYRLWQERYLKIFDNMIVSTRVKDMKHKDIMDKKGYTISNGKNVEIIPIDEYNKLTDVFFKKNKVISQLKKVIEKVDCVIIRLPSPLGNLACDVCRKMKKKYAIEVVACAWDGYRNHGHWAGKIVAPYMYKETKKQCKKAKRVLYVTREFLQKRYPTNGITTNASNVLISKSTEEVLKHRINKIRKNKCDKIVLGLVGSLDIKIKGHEVALKAMEILIKKYPNIKIEFLGPGEGTNIKKLIERKKLSDNVEIKGTLPGGEAVLNWMDNLDILLIPSFTEGLPRVLIEAMSRACPAVGSKVGGIPELIRDDLVHKPGDFNKLAEDIERIIEDKEFAVLIAKENFDEAKQYAKENLDIKRAQFWNDFRDGEE